MISGTKHPDTRQFVLRVRVVFFLLLLSALALIARAAYLQTRINDFLVAQGNSRFSRVVPTRAHRGEITDRFGELLAVSTPVDSIWVNPQELMDAPEAIKALAHALKREPNALTRYVSSNLDRSFLYVARQLQPYEAAVVRERGITGVYFSREYRRYYPAGEVMGHLLGFTNVDDEGQEGLELSYNSWLAGVNGLKRVIQDRYGRVVQNVESITDARPGRDLVLSIDLRIQYLAYRELKQAFLNNRAVGASMVVLDVDTGEVLAMVDQPGYNPNDREQLAAEHFRNRAMTDLFEPGSSMKPFVLAAALSSGRFRKESVIDTSPGYIEVGDRRVSDENHDFGAIDLTTILAKSSNVGMTKVALALQPRQLWEVLEKFGFGRVTGAGFPGEAAGIFSDYSHWRPVGISSLSRGYGVSVTALQLAHAYSVLGTGGIDRPVTFLRSDDRTSSEGVDALDPHVSEDIMSMLEAVVGSGGTGKKAAVNGYRVAGKTGTARKAVDGGYDRSKHFAVFAGMVPASRPKLVAIVMFDEPNEGEYHGGDVAAPVFANVMSGALRLLSVAPDDVDYAKARSAQRPERPIARD
jgi:cell division protein FtsI (penicillin-binding protein 3)